jgi:hypothetical protein
VPRVKIEVRQILQRLLYRKDKYFGGDGRGEIILLLRCLLESSGNEDAIGEPIIVSAVAGCLEPKFIDRGVALIEALPREFARSLLRDRASQQAGGNSRATGLKAGAGPG